MTRDGLLTGVDCVSEDADAAPDTAAGRAIVLDMVMQMRRGPGRKQSATRQSGAGGIGEF